MPCPHNEISIVQRSQRQSAVAAAAYPVSYTHLLANLNEQAQERLDTIMEQMKAAEGVTEDLKRTRQMEWVQR